MIFWVKYGFENTPLKMYNMNVQAPIFLSFLRATCIKDIDDYCKQRNIQLSIELDAIRRSMQQSKSTSTVAPAASPPSSAPPSRPASGASVNSSAPVNASRPMTPSTTRLVSSVDDNLDGHTEEQRAATEKKRLLERQMEVITTASRLVKELVTEISWVDLIDQNGARMNLDTVGSTRLTSILTARQQYTAVAVTIYDNGECRVTPLVFKLTQTPSDLK